MQYFFSDGYMIRIKKIKNEEDFKRYSPILQEFEKEGGTSKKHSPKSQSFFSKIKEVWEDLT